MAVIFRCTIHEASHKLFPAKKAVKMAIKLQEEEQNGPSSPSASPVPKKESNSMRRVLALQVFF